MGNMYSDVVKGVSNVMVGCKWMCKYCIPSFQAQMKRQLHNCKLCYDYIPHFHEERLKQSLPQTKGDEFIWLIRSGDPCFAEYEWIEKILDVVQSRKNYKKTFLFQTKDPDFFHVHDWPINCILGITLETNRKEGYSKISKAPNPIVRWRRFRRVDHERKMVTIEPILQFDLKKFISIIYDIQPERVYIGYNSKKTPILPEPSLDKTLQLIRELRKFTIVKEKLIREGRKEPKQVGLEVFNK